MSNHLSLAATTAAIALATEDALERAFGPSPSARVRCGPPDADSAFAGCTLFLYRVQTSAFVNNDSLPTRDASGALVRIPRVALDADYLFTFFGDEGTLEPQRLLGAALVGFAAHPVLSPHESDRIRLVLRSIDEETMGQIWHLFPDVPYRLSVVYRASVISIEDAAVLNPG